MKGNSMWILVFRSIIITLINTNKQLIPKNNIVSIEED